MRGSVHCVRNSVFVNQHGNHVVVLLEVTWNYRIYRRVVCIFILFELNTRVKYILLLHVVVLDQNSLNCHLETGNLNSTVFLCGACFVSHALPVLFCFSWVETISGNCNYMHGVCYIFV